MTFIFIVLISFLPNLSYVIIPTSNFQKVEIPFYSSNCDYIISYTHISSSNFENFLLLLNLKTEIYQDIYLYLYDNLTKLYKDEYNYRNYIATTKFYGSNDWKYLRIKSYGNKTLFFAWSKYFQYGLNTTFQLYDCETYVNLSKHISEEIYFSYAPKEANILLKIPKNHRNYLLYGYKNKTNTGSIELKISEENNKEVKILSDKNEYFENYFELKNDCSYLINLTLINDNSFIFYFSLSNFKNKIFHADINTEYFQQFHLLSEANISILLDMTSIIKGNKMLFEYQDHYSKFKIKAYEIKVYGYITENRDIIQNTTGEELELIEYDKCTTDLCQKYLRKKSSDLKYAIVKVSRSYSDYVFNMRYGKQDKYFPTTIYLSCGIALALVFPNILIHIINKCCYEENKLPPLLVFIDLFFHLGFFNMISKFGYFGGNASFIFGLVFLCFYLIALIAYFCKIKEKEYKSRGLGCLYQRVIVTKTIEEALNINRNLKPKLIIKIRSFHQESREKWEYIKEILQLGLPRVFYDYNKGHYLENPVVGVERKVIDCKISDWGRVDEGGGKYKKEGKSLFDCGYELTVEKREIQAWNKEQEINYNSWQDDTNFISENYVPILKAQFDLKINFDEETKNYIKNLKNELITESKTYDTKYEIIEQFEVPEFKKEILCLPKNDKTKNILLFIFGLISTLCGYCSLINFFFNYKEKLVKIEIVKSVSISNRYMVKADSNNIIADDSKLILPFKSSLGDDNNSFLLEPINE